MKSDLTEHNERMEKKSDDARILPDSQRLEHEEKTWK